MYQTLAKIALKTALKLHQMWLNNEDGGKRFIYISINLRDAYLTGADLRGAYLTGADLTGADLRGTDLTGADLTGADLTGAYLTGANLRGTYLTGANLRYANLRGANLRGANLTDADLTDAYLTGADLTGANLHHQVCPETGSFDAYKKCQGHIVKLRIPAKAKRLTAYTSRKCRCEFAKVLNITIEGKPTDHCFGGHDPEFRYEVGKTVTPDKYDDDARIECSHGIHFFITRKEAEEW